jgi:hypothetical protein
MARPSIINAPGMRRREGIRYVNKVFSVAAIPPGVSSLRYEVVR